MKTTITKTAFALLAFGMLFTACSKDDNKGGFPEENPLAKYYEATGFTNSTNLINGSSSEFGLAFSPKVKGKINALTVRIPDANPNLRVTIWDYDQKIILRTEFVNVATANTEVVKSISAMDLEKDKKYMITMNSNDFYKKARADNSAATYPVTAGNIVFHSYAWISASGQTFPTSIDYTYNGGDLSFVFQRTE